MDFWMPIWKIVLIAAAAVFLVLAVVVSIGGVFDIRKLLKRIGQSDKISEEQ